MASNENMEAMRSAAFMIEQLQGINKRIAGINDRLTKIGAERSEALAERANLVARIDAEVTKIRSAPGV